MELWVPLTIFAAFFQNFRSMLQKQLKVHLGTEGATFVRFGFGVPFAVFYFFAVLQVTGETLPSANAAFIQAATLGAITQIIGTASLLYLLSLRNFVVGTAYSKTEPLQAAAIGLLILGEWLNSLAFMSIITGVCGILLISYNSNRQAGSGFRSLINKPALIGLATAALFGGSAVFYRSASLSLDEGSFLLRASFTLVVAIVLQTIVMLLWIAFKNRDVFRRLAKAWKPSLVVGFFGASASFGWFCAMTLVQVSHVKALAQIELAFAIIASALLLREHISKIELTGCALIAAGGVGIVLAG